VNAANEQAQCDVEMSVSWDEPLDTALIVLANGWASVAQLSEAIQLRRSCRPKIGELAIHEGRMTIAQVFRVLEHEAVHGGLFGEIAIDKGLLDEADLYKLLRIQAMRTPRLTAILLANGLLTEQQVETLKQQIGSQHDRHFNFNLD
jgi:hypothetical protein